MNLFHAQVFEEMVDQDVSSEVKIDAFDLPLLLVHKWILPCLRCLPNLRS